MTDVVLSKLFQVPTLDWTGGYSLEKMSSRRTQYIQALRKADRGDYTGLFTFAGINK